MLILSPGQVGIFEYIFNVGENYYDPTSGATPSDVLISVYRGDLGAGAIIDGPYSYLYQDVQSQSNYIQKNTDVIFYYGDYGNNPGENTGNLNVTKFSFYYTIPDNLYPGNYSVVATTYYENQVVQYTAQFQVPESGTTILAPYAPGQKELTKSFVPAFEQLEQYKTNSVALIGHADGLDPYTVVRISSIQEAIDLLNANFNSPLLKGVFDAYAAGARDIYICVAGPMSEYVDSLQDRLSPSPVYGRNDATPLMMNFYQRYFLRLNKVYEVLKNFDYIDIVVPLEATFINSGGVDFTTQLAMYCQEFHDLSGFIQIGVIGSRNGGIKIEDIDLLEQDSRFQYKYTMFDSNNQIAGDMGRFVVPIYGEVIMNHNFLNTTYTTSGAATMAGLMSANPVNESLIRKRAISVFGISGSALSQVDVDRLDALGINTFTKGVRSRRGNNYEIFISNDYTMAHRTSTFSKLPQIRLVSMVVNEIKALASNTISKFSSQKATEDVRAMLNFLKNNAIIRDYEMDAYVDSLEKGKMYFDISLTSTLGLRKISFSISAGQGA